MTNTVPITIRLLKKSITIKCPPAETENLFLAADKLEQHLSEKKAQFPRLDEYNLLLLAALQVSHELIIDRGTNFEQNQQLSHLISLLENKINRSYEDGE